MALMRWAFKRSLVVRIGVLYAIHVLPKSMGNWLGDRCGVAELLLQAGIVSEDDLRECRGPP